MAVATFCGIPDFVLIHCDFLWIPGEHYGCYSHWLCDRWIQVLVDYATIRVIDTRCMIAHGLLLLRGHVVSVILAQFKALWFAPRAIAWS